MFVFDFVELRSVLGVEAPLNPGGDFFCCCLIEADDEQAALEWGYAVLGDYSRARFQHSGRPRAGKPVREREIVKGVDPDELLRADPSCARCKLGELPAWIEPWKNCRAAGVRPA